MCSRVWDGGFENNNSNEMMARGVVGTTDITRTIKVTHTIKVIDIGKMVKDNH